MVMEDKMPRAWHGPGTADRSDGYMPMKDKMSADRSDEYMVMTGKVPGQ